jgi:SET domain-containing protein
MIIYLIIYSVDATFATGLGRLVNDAEAKMANCQIKNGQHGKPHLAIYAKRDITCGEELHYDYGVKDLHWCKTQGNLH